MVDHTPTPWRVEEGTDLIWGACNPDDRSSYGMGYSIVEGKLPSWKPYKPDYEEREANAAFIVKAVNNHEALVKALQDIIDENDEFRKGMPADWEGDPLEDACDAAKVVLAAVGGSRND